MPRAAAVSRAAVPTPTLPVSVIAGYLGTGKTTLINRLLRDCRPLRVAVLVNDFGQLNIDAELIESASGQTISLTNGCVCCAIADDLGAAFEALAQTRSRLDHVLLEASGVADALKLGRNADTWPGFRLQQIVTLVDASRTRNLLVDKYVGQHVKRQLVESNRLLASKTDLLSHAELSRFLVWLAGITPVEAVTTTDMDVHTLLDVTPTPEVASSRPTQTHHPNHSSRTFSSAAAVSREQIESWLGGLPHQRLRIKGFLRLMEDPRAAFVLQVVDAHHSITPSPNTSVEPGNRLVVISQHADAIANPFES